MKKIISLALSLVMILSMVTVCFAAAPSADSVGKVASGYAPEGTGIDSLDKITDAAGKYYLTADITVETTFATAFTGTLDGNGHKVTVKVPMFADLQGTVKNLTMTGGIDYTATASHAGVLAVMSTAGTVNVTNVKNEATVKGYLSNIAKADGTVNVRTGAAGLIGHVSGETTVVVDNCANTAAINGYAPAGMIGYVNGATVSITVKNSVNTGKISNDGATKPSGGNNSSAGGFVAMSDNAKTFVFENLVNDGEVSANAASAPAGGIVGYIYTGIKDKADGLCTMTNCVNNAKVTGANQVGGVGGWVRLNMVATKCVNNGVVESTANYAGGVFGRVGSDGFSATETEIKMCETKLVECANTAAVTSSKSQVGGIVGYASAYVEAENCTNSADIDGKAATAGGILGTVENSKLTNCVNTGDITSDSGNAGGIMGYAPGLKNKLVSAADGKYNTDIQKCLNTGNIAGGKNSGGIVGHAGRADAFGLVSIMYSINTGNVTCTGAAATAHSNGSAAGMLGYSYGSAGQWPFIKYNITTGNVEVKHAEFGIAAYFAGYFNSAKAVISDNVASGTLTSPSDNARVFAICWDNASALDAANIVGNVIPAEYKGNLTHEKVTEGETTKEVLIPISGDGAKYTVTTITAADVSSGKVAYDLNQKIGSVVFKQTIGTDATPNFTGKDVLKTDTGYANPAAPVTPPTGDATVVIVLALVAVSAGAVLTLKKRQSVR